MKFQQVMAFFLTGATALSMSTTALAADLPDNVDITVSTTQTADEQENNLYTKNDKDLTDAEFEQKYELPENSWFTPAVRYVIENNIMLPAGHIDGKEYFPWFNPAENRCTVAEAIYNSAKLVDPETNCILCRAWLLRKRPITPKSPSFTVMALRSALNPAL